MESDDVIAKIRDLIGTLDRDLPDLAVRILDKAEERYPTKDFLAIAVEVTEIATNHGERHGILRLWAKNAHPGPAKMEEFWEQAEANVAAAKQQRPGL